jgi:hypothetical protein
MNKPDEHTIYYRLKLGQDEYTGETVPFGGGNVTWHSIFTDLAIKANAVLVYEGIPYGALNGGLPPDWPTEEQIELAEDGRVIATSQPNTEGICLDVKVIRL